MAQSPWHRKTTFVQWNILFVARRSRNMSNESDRDLRSGSLHDLWAARQDTKPNVCATHKPKCLSTRVPRNGLSSILPGIGQIFCQFLRWLLVKGMPPDQGSGLIVIPMPTPQPPPHTTMKMLVRERGYFVVPNSSNQIDLYREGSFRRHHISWLFGTFQPQPAGGNNV